MKIIKYRLATEINHGTPELPDIETVLSNVTMPQTRPTTSWPCLRHGRAKLP